MSIIVENTEHERTIEGDNQTIIKLLKAILLGIEIIADQDLNTLIDNVEEE